MSNRKFRIIMQTVCIFRVIVVYFRAQDKRIPRRQLPQPPLLPAFCSCWCQSSWSLEPSLDQPHSVAVLYFPCTAPPPPWPPLIIIEFLEISQWKEKETRLAIFAFGDNERVASRWLGHRLSPFSSSAPSSSSSDSVFHCIIHTETCAEPWQ